MSKTKITVPMVICIKDDVPIIKIVREIIVRSVEVKADTICFLPAKKGFSVFCCNKEGTVPIQVNNMEKNKGALFFEMIDRIKILLGMKISDRKNCQTGSFEKTGDLPAFTAITTSTEFGESIQMKLYL